MFVRSSTNSEDLPGFNGAGLYDTLPNVVGKKAIGEALKGVWASVWQGSLGCHLACEAPRYRRVKALQPGDDEPAAHIDERPGRSSRSGS